MEMNKKIMIHRKISPFLWNRYKKRMNKLFPNIDILNYALIQLLEWRDTIAYKYVEKGKIE